MGRGKLRTQGNIGPEGTLRDHQIFFLGKILSGSISLVCPQRSPVALACPQCVLHSQEPICIPSSPPRPQTPCAASCLCAFLFKFIPVFPLGPHYPPTWGFFYNHWKERDTLVYTLPPRPQTRNGPLVRHHSPQWQQDLGLTCEHGLPRGFQQFPTATVSLVTEILI